MRQLRMGMIGGGPGAFIGPVHRTAAELDGRIALVAGAFSSDPARSAAAGVTYRIDPARCYADFATMVHEEATRADGVDFIAVVTPNHLHLPAARAALQAEFPVFSDKPATATLEQAHELAAVVAQTGKPYALSFTYTGYPLVREARARVRDGAIGDLRKVVVEYAQGWLAEPIERDGNKQASWRQDPAQAGIGGCIGDIGVHAFNLLEFVAGQNVVRLCPDLNALVPNRVLDDDCNILLRMANGAPGVLIASQIATGQRNGLRLRVYGSLAALDWCQEAPNRLLIDYRDGRSEVIHAGTAALGADARAATRLPAGHPEGYLESFANLYGDFATLLQDGTAPLLPGIDAGLRSMAFMHTAVHASRNGSGWADLVV